MPIRFSQSSIKASFMVENPGWYKYELTKVIKKRADNGKSDNYIFIWEGRSGEMEGVPVSDLINEGADWLLLPIFTAANGGNPPEVDRDYEPSELVGITLEANTKRGNRQDGTPQNKLVEWAPLGTNIKD